MSRTLPAISLCLCWVIVLGKIVLTSRAQEALEYSQAGEAAAEAARVDPGQEPYYNVKLGPVLFTFNAGTGVEFNDNINLSETNPEPDIVLRPGVGMTAFWQVTELNSLNLNLGVQYAKYIQQPENDSESILINPGSDLTFDLYVQDFKFTFYDDFSIEQDPTELIEVSNVAVFTRFQNTGGMIVLWDLNDVELEAGYSYTIFRALDDPVFNFTDRDSQSVTTSATFFVDPSLAVGVSGSGTFSTYQESFLNDSVVWQPGVFVDWQASQYITVSIATGMQIGDFSDTGAVDDDSSLGAPFATLTVNHRLNQYVNLALAAGHEANQSLESNYYELTYVRLAADWAILKDISLGTDIFYEHAPTSGGILSEDIHRYGGGITLNYAITEKLTTGLEFRHIERESSAALRDYSQNAILFNLDYDF